MIPKKARGIKPEAGPLVTSCRECGRIVTAEEIAKYTAFILHIWGILQECEVCQREKDYDIPWSF